jgi:hypothetical protein
LMRGLAFNLTMVSKSAPSAKILIASRLMRSIAPTPPTPSQARYIIVCPRTPEIPGCHAETAEPRNSAPQEPRSIVPRPSLSRGATQAATPHCDSGPRTTPIAQIRHLDAENMAPHPTAAAVHAKIAEYRQIPNRPTDLGTPASRLGSFSYQLPRAHGRLL